MLSGSQQGVREIRCCQPNISLSNFSKTQTILNVRYHAFFTAIRMRPLPYFHTVFTSKYRINMPSDYYRPTAVAE